MTKKVFALFICALFFATAGINLGMADDELSAYFLDYGYFDGGNDGLSNDTFAVFVVKGEFDDSACFILFSKLQLPSGEVTVYDFVVDQERDIEIYRLIFHNHATEVGDYVIELDFVWRSDDTILTNHIEVVFDSPGRPGTQPPSASLEVGVNV